MEQRQRRGPRNQPTHRVVNDVLAECAHALTKHGPPTTDPTRGITVLTEELGEAAEEALKLTSSNPSERGEMPREERVARLRHELAQLAGYSMLLMQAIDTGRLGREGYQRDPQP